MLYPNDYGIQNTAPIHFYKVSAEKGKSISDWEEWQANTLAAAILLPQDLIKQAMFLFGLGVKIYCLNKIYHPNMVVILSLHQRHRVLLEKLVCQHF